MSADSDSRRDEEYDDEESPPTEEEQVETEWHFWLLAILLLGGVTLILFPPNIWPDLGFALVAVAVIGWVLKEITERTL